MLVQEIIITEQDRWKLMQMIDTLREHGDPFVSHARALEEELANAAIVSATEIAPNVVTMHSVVQVMDLHSHEKMKFTLVYHGESDLFDNRLSVLTSLGIRVLGTRVGDVVEWDVPRGVRRLRIEDVLYQPEAAGEM